MLYWKNREKTKFPYFMLWNSKKIEHHKNLSISLKTMNSENQNITL